MTPDNAPQGDPKDGARRLASFGFKLFLALYIFFDLGTIFHFVQWLQIVSMTVLTIVGVAFAAYVLLTKNLPVLHKIPYVFVALFFMIRSLYTS